MPDARITLSDRLRRRFYRSEDHPYRVFERKVLQHLGPDSTLLDAGCGRAGEVLLRLRDKAKRLIGVDVVQFDERLRQAGILLLNNDLRAIGLADKTVDVVLSRSVMEHVDEPLQVYHEAFRILKPSGYFVFLTANLWDYGTLFSRIIPSKFHPRIVAALEGRREEDTFPTHYRTNTVRAVKRCAAAAGFEVRSISHLGQYPSYMLFNPIAFLMGTLYEKVTSKFHFLRFFRGWLLVVLGKPSRKEV